MTHKTIARILSRQICKPSLTEGEVDPDMMDKIQALSNKKIDEISEEIAKLDLDDMLDLIDAVEIGDEAKILLILNTARHVDEDDEENEDETPVDIENIDDIEDDEPDSRHGVTVHGDIDEALSTGQIVKVGDDESTVKIADAPGNTAGVLIDGELTMVNKKKIKRVDENVIELDGALLDRIRKLAGIAAQQQVSDETQNAAANVMATGGMELPVPAAAENEVEEIEGAQQALATEIEADEAEETEEVEGSVDGEDCDDCDDDLGAERPHEVETQADPETEIMAALEIVAKNIRNAKIGSYKAINDKITHIQGSLYESLVINRKTL